MNCDMTRRLLMRAAVIVPVAIAALSSCDDRYKDEFAEIQAGIDDVNRRLDSIAAAVNSEVASLERIVKAVEENDYITSVEPVYEGGALLGYRITFFKGGEIMITNGKDGQDGADGKDGEDGKDGQDGQDGTDGKDGRDGHSPVIGARQDTDGKWYWTLDGEWLLGPSGTKICLNPEDGKDGSDGSDGKDGKDAVSPLMKIENGHWFISVDGGKTWSDYGPACGADGADGADGVVAETIFDYVYFMDGNAFFALKSGQIMIVPVYTAFTMTLSQTSDIPVRAGGKVVLRYELFGVEGDVNIVCAAEGDWTARVDKTDIDSGNIAVTAPSPFSEGKVVVFANAADGRMCIETLTFVELTE